MDALYESRRVGVMAATQRANYFGQDCTGTVGMTLPDYFVLPLPGHLLAGFVVFTFMVDTSGGRNYYVP